MSFQHRPTAKTAITTKCRHISNYKRDIYEHAHRAFHLHLSGVFERQSDLGESRVPLAHRFERSAQLFAQQLQFLLSQLQLPVAKQDGRLALLGRRLQFDDEVRFLKKQNKCLSKIFA